MNKRTSLFLNLSMFISVTMIFFGSYITNLYYLQAIACGLAILSGYKKKLKIKQDTIMWLLACLISIFSIAISEDKESTIEIASMIIMIIIIKIVYENNQNGWQKTFLTMITIASGIHVVATLLQLIFPNFIATISNMLLNKASFQLNQEFLKRGSYAGITSQTSVNAYFIAIFIGITFSRIISQDKHKKINIVLLVLGFITLFMTGKRGLLLFTAISVIFVFLYTIHRDKKKSFKYILIFTIIVSIGYVTMINIPETQIVFEKMKNLEKNDNILNGRDYLWEESIKIFLKNPAFGIGEGRIDGILGDASHNTYIQLLAETGIIGFCIYNLAFLISFIFSIKKAKRIFKEQKNNSKKIVIISLYMQVLFITYGFTGNPLYSNIFFTPYILAIAMINAIPIDKEREVNNEDRNNYIP